MNESSSAWTLMAWGKVREKAEMGHVSFVGYGKDFGFYSD